MGVQIFMTTQTDDVVAGFTLTNDEVTFYQRYGYLVLPGWVHEDALPGLRDEVYAIMAARGFSRERLNHANETADKLRQASEYLRGSHLDRLINGAGTLRLASCLIGGHAIRYLPFTAVKSGGGGGQFHFHQDNNYTPHEPALGSLNIWVALVDMTPENGCLMMAPESHRQGTWDAEATGDGDTHRKVRVTPANILPLRMRAGDAVAFTRLTVHGSGPNTTGTARLAYALQYHRDDVKYLDRSTDAWKRLDDEPRFQTPPLNALPAAPAT